jgi:hypothetical protein
MGVDREPFPRYSDGYVIYKALLRILMKILPSFKKNYSENRLFFCINSGRAGSQYLSELLGTAKEVISYHEPEPNMSGKYLTMINEELYDKTFEARLIKCKAIKKLLRRFSRNEVYCETNHMFIKTFFDVIMSEFDNNIIEILILRRNAVKVLKSFIEMGYFSPFNTYWPKWMSSPNAKTAAIGCLHSDDKMDQYDRCIAYLIDIEARAQRFLKDYPHIKVHNIRLEDLRSFDNVNRLWDDLTITCTRKTYKVFKKVINKRAKVKNEMRILTNMEYCHERMGSYIERAEAAGIQIPETLVWES